jgi:hypothetical protein
MLAGASEGLFILLSGSLARRGRIGYNRALAEASESGKHLDDAVVRLALRDLDAGLGVAIHAGLLFRQLRNRRLQSPLILAIRAVLAERLVHGLDVLQ